jgi:uncharacterized spore protein YtfJ
MTTNRSKTLAEAQSAARRAAEAGPIGGVSERLARWVGQRAGVQAVFGDPVDNGDTVVIPVARSMWAVGGGAGGGQADADAGSDGPSGSGYGSGGGGAVMTVPVGYLELRPDGARFRPIGHGVNPAVILAGGLATAIVLRALARLVRG